MSPAFELLPFLVPTAVALGFILCLIFIFIGPDK